MKKHAYLLIIGFILIVFALFMAYQVYKPAKTHVKPTSPDSQNSMNSQAAPPNHDMMIQVKKLQDHLKMNPDDLNHWIQLGNLLFDNGKFSDAVGPYQTALRLKSDNTDVRTDMAVCFFNMNQNDVAIAELERVLKISSGHITALFNLGVINAKIGNAERADFYWSKVVKISPQSELGQKASRSLSGLHLQKRP